MKSISKTGLDLSVHSLGSFIGYSLLLKQRFEKTTQILVYLDVMDSVALDLAADTTFIPQTKGAVLDW